VLKHNYNKDDYDEMRQSIKINGKNYFYLCMMILIPPGGFLNNNYKIGV